MQKMTFPVLYSFRRCPYAMRARLAIAGSGTQVEIREILLKQKPAEMLAASPKGTVPVLVLSDGTVIDESIDIMRWALEQNDPAHWRTTDETRLIQAEALIFENDQEFKPCLDHYKYAIRFPEKSEAEHRQSGLAFIEKLEKQLTHNTHLFGDNPSYADMAIFPFIRQFAGVDRQWFDNSPYPNVKRWLADHLQSELFANVMQKLPPWQAPSC